MADYEDDFEDSETSSVSVSKKKAPAPAPVAPGNVIGGPLAGTATPAPVAPPQPYVAPTAAPAAANPTVVPQPATSAPALAAPVAAPMVQTAPVPLPAPVATPTPNPTAYYTAPPVAPTPAPVVAPVPQPVAATPAPVAAPSAAMDPIAQILAAASAAPLPVAKTAAVVAPVPVSKTANSSLSSLSSSTDVSSISTLGATAARPVQPAPVVAPAPTGGVAPYVPTASPYTTAAAAAPLGYMPPGGTAPMPQPAPTTTFTQPQYYTPASTIASSVILPQGLPPQAPPVVAPAPTATALGPTTTIGAAGTAVGVAPNILAPVGASTVPVGGVQPSPTILQPGGLAPVGSTAVPLTTPPVVETANPTGVPPTPPTPAPATAAEVLPDVPVNVVVPKRKPCYFAGTTVTVPVTRAHVDPSSKKVADLKQRLKDKEKALVEHAKEQLLRRDLYYSKIESERKEAAKKTKMAIEDNKKKTENEGALVVVPTGPVVVPSLPEAELFAKMDRETPQVMPSNLCGVCYYNDHEKVKEVLDTIGKRVKGGAKQIVDVWGFVPYRGRYYGLKKQRLDPSGETKNYCLGIGSKGTPLHFAILAGRLDVVVTLLQNGAKWNHSKEFLKGSPSVKELAKINKFQGALEFIEAFEKDVKEQEEKVKNMVIGGMIRYEKDLRKKAKARREAERLGEESALAMMANPRKDP